MKRYGKITIRGCAGSDFRRVAFLSFFLCFGILLGCFFSRYTSAQALRQLSDYLDSYMGLKDSFSGLLLFLCMGAVYFRYCLLLFLFSFSSVGTVLIPLLCAVQGFSLAFTATLFARCSDGGILTALSLLFVRCLFVLPTTLYFGCAAILSAGRGRESRNISYWRHLGICMCVLLLGAVLEATIVPDLFAALFPA